MSAFLIKGIVAVGAAMYQKISDLMEAFNFEKVIFSGDFWQL